MLPSVPPMPDIVSWAFHARNLNPTDTKREFAMFRPLRKSWPYSPISDETIHSSE